MTAIILRDPIVLSIIATPIAKNGITNDIIANNKAIPKEVRNCVRLIGVTNDKIHDDAVIAKEIPTKVINIAVLLTLNLCIIVIPIANLSK